MWDTYHHEYAVLDDRRKAAFLGDKDYNFVPPTPCPRRLFQRTPPPSSPPPPPAQKKRDGSNNFVATVFDEIQIAHVEGRQIESPKEVTGEEATRLALVMSEMRLPQLQYAIERMTACV
jgi:hypothetical protein